MISARSPPTAILFNRLRDALSALMVYEKRDPDADSTSTATRVRLVLNPGQTAGLDSEEGRSLNFTCAEVSAAVLVVDSGEREKLVELQKLPLRKTASD